MGDQEVGEWDGVLSQGQGGQEAPFEAETWNEQGMGCGRLLGT